MASKHVISFSVIAEFFKNDTAQLQKGENSYESGNVVRMIFDGEVVPALLKGEVRASMRNKKYTVEISIDFDDGIVDTKCSCPRGLAACHHMAALCIYAHHNISVTDKSCVWNKPNKPEEVDVITKIKDIYQPKKTNYVAVQRPANDNELDLFKKELGDSNPTGFSWWLMSTPSEKMINLIPSIEDVIFSEEYGNALNKESFFMEKCSVTQDIIQSVHQLTIGQGNNENWLIARKNRITSSKFGVVLSACRRNKYAKSLFKSLLEGYDLSGVQAIQWGRENEKYGVDKLQQITGLIVEPAGFYLHECGFLGTSPDGYVSEKCLIEVKCPFKYRKEKDLKKALEKDKSYIIYFDEGSIKVNENHNYYHQIQGALFITNRDMCYLVIWIPNDCIIKRISRNHEWEENLDMLKSVYLRQFLPQIYS